MPNQPTTPGAQSDAAAQRRRLAEVFGDILPETTGDDVPDRGADGTDERWYTENRPPHHDSG